VSLRYGPRTLLAIVSRHCFDVLGRSGARHDAARLALGLTLWTGEGVVLGAPSLPGEFPDYHGDNWLLTGYAGFVDLGFLRLLA
jgi:hypothetical protein